MRSLVTRSTIARGPGDPGPGVDRHPEAVGPDPEAVEPARRGPAAPATVDGVVRPAIGVLEPPRRRTPLQDDAVRGVAQVQGQEQLGRRHADRTGLHPPTPLRRRVGRDGHHDQRHLRVVHSHQRAEPREFHDLGERAVPQLRAQVLRAWVTDQHQRRDDGGGHRDQGSDEPPRGDAGLTRSRARGRNGSAPACGSGGACRGCAGRGSRPSWVR